MKSNAPLLSLCLILAFVGCKPEEIKQYKVAKVQASAVKTTANTQTQSFTYTMPKSWQDLGASGMRQAAFKTPDGGEVTVVSLPGQAGDLKGNVNRWRGQVGLPPVQNDSEYLKEIKAIQVDKLPAISLELHAPEGQPDKSMKVVLMEANGKSWFFKLAGPRKSIQSQSEALTQFTESIHFASSQDLERSAPADNPSTSNNAMSSAMLPAVKDNTRLVYNLPQGWQEKPGNPMRKASFEVQNAQGDPGDVSIVTLAGDGGGLLQNANRWRQQLEMAPTDDTGLKNSVKDIEVAGNKGYFMKLFTGLEGNGMLVALIEREGQTWFIKMTGPSPLIEAQESPFMTFLKSLRFEEKGAPS